MQVAEKAVHIVDDDEAVRKALTRSLEQRGFTVSSYASCLLYTSDAADE